MKKLFFILTAAFILTLTSFSNSFAQTAEKSLYERLGSINSIAAVVDDFIDKLLSDPLITANKDVVAGLAHTTKPGLKVLITELLCEKSGGPQKYSGKSMKESHEGLNITDAEWQAMIKDLLASLNKFKVPNKEQIEVIVIVNSTKDDIVTKQAAPAAEAPPAPPPQAAPEAKPAEVQVAPPAPPPQAAP